jgi:hypothetical protein
MLPKVKPKEMLEKGKKGWETAKPVAGPLLGQLAKAYLEKGHWGVDEAWERRRVDDGLLMDWWG